MSETPRLWALVAEARSGTITTTWVLFPPAPHPGDDGTQAGGAWRFMKRRQNNPAHRAVWKFTSDDDDGDAAGRMMAQLASHASTGTWEFAIPLAVPMDEDDYLLAWEGTGATPHKVLRQAARQRVLAEKRAG